MAKVYVGGLAPGAEEREVEDEFSRFGKLQAVWVARNPAGFAFVTFEDQRDADDAIAALDGKNGWKVENARPPRPRDGGYGGGRGFGGGDRYGGGGGFGGGGGRGGDRRCYQCGEAGHFARECPQGGGGGGGGGGARYGGGGGGSYGGGGGGGRDRDRGSDRYEPRRDDRGREDRGRDYGRGSDRGRDRSPYEKRDRASPSYD